MKNKKIQKITELKDLGEVLKKDGVAVIKFPGTKEEFKALQNLFKKDHLKCPYILPTKSKEFYEKPALSAFGATPYFTYAPHQRKAREWFSFVLNNISSSFKDKYKFGFVHPDRSSVRVPDTTIGSETYHRDFPSDEFQKRDDLTIGGWLNLLSEQKFVCVPGSHLENIKGSSFTKISKKDADDLIKKEKHYIIPEGCMIFFYATIAHRICPGKIKQRQEKIYTGLIFTNIAEVYDMSPLITLEDETLDEKLHRSLTLQIPLNLPSGQRPRIYEKLHAVNWKDRLKEFRKLFRHEVNELSDNENYPPIYPPSLSESNLPLYKFDIYKEIKILTPTIL